MAFPGLGSGLGFSLSSTTDVDGTYTIEDVPDHLYPAFAFTADGYETKTTNDVDVTADITGHGQGAEPRLGGVVRRRGVEVLHTAGLRTVLRDQRERGLRHQHRYRAGRLTRSRTEAAA